MSLILTCLSQNYLIIVTDTRLREWGPQQLGSPSDGANKIVAWMGIAVFSYAGVGRLGTQAIDKWVAERLARRSSTPTTNPFVDAVEDLRHGATDLFRQEIRASSTPHLNRLRHTFIGVGHMAAGSSRLAVISNASQQATLSPEHPEGIDYCFQWAVSPREEFEASALDLELIRTPIIIPIGSCVTGAGKLLLKQASRAVREKRTSSEVESLLKEVISEVGRHDPNVSRTSKTVVSQGVLTGSGAGIGSGMLSTGTLAVMKDTIWSVGSQGGRGFV